MELDCDRSRRKFCQLMAVAPLCGCAGHFVREATSVIEYGAVGDGQVDDTVAFQRAIAESDVVLVPPGQFVVGDLEVRSNHSMVGHGYVSVLRQKPGARFLVSINSGSQGSSAIHENVRNVAFRNLHFHGNVREEGFFEYAHLMNANACSDLTIENCLFSGFRGDAIYLGSGNAQNIERHNSNVLVRNCVFDGETFDNRNGISVIDCDGLRVAGNVFVRCSRGNMPGAIDIEPDENSFHRIRNIQIQSNAILSCRGGVGCINVVIPLAHFDQGPMDITISHNLVHGGDAANGISLIGPRTLRGSLEPINIVVSQNRVVNSARPFQVTGLREVLIRQNQFLESKFESAIGEKRPCEDIVIADNDFIDNGTSGRPALQVFGMKHSSISENRFHNWGGRVTGIAAVRFAGPNSSDVDMDGNSFTHSSALHRSAIQHGASAAGIRLKGNRLSPGLGELEITQ